MADSDDKSSVQYSHPNQFWFIVLSVVIMAPMLALACAFPFSMQGGGPHTPGLICLIAVSYYSSGVGFWAGLGWYWWRWQYCH